MQLSTYTAVAWLSAVLALLVGGVALRRRRVPGALPFACFMAAIALWCFTIGSEVLAVDLTAKVTWSKIQYLGLYSMPVFLLTFALDFSGRSGVLSRPWRAALWVIPVAMIVLAATNEWHGWVWSSFSPSPIEGSTMILYDQGTLFWVGVIYAHVLVALSLILLIEAVFRWRWLYRVQAWLLVLSFPLPWLANIAYVLRWTAGYDFTPMTFVLVGALYLLAILRFHLFDLLPVARDTVIERMPDGVMVVDAQGRVVDLNPAAAADLRTRGEGVGRPAAEVLAPLLDLEALPSEDTEFETRLEGPSGPPRFLHLRVFPFHDLRGAAAGHLLIWRDITRLKAAEARLREYSHSLEARVLERTRALEEAQEQLLRRERLAVLGQMAGSVGHELRNPLGTIGNALYLLQQALGDATPPAAREFLEIADHEVRRASEIIHDLLDFSRERAADRQAVDIRAVLDEALARTPLTAGVRLEDGVPAGLPPLCADPKHLVQIINNLVLNACEAMPQGGVLALAAEIDDGYLHLRVADSGVGIAPEDMRRVFEPLFTTKSGGIGLGLSICKRLAEANEGWLSVESGPGVGSTFTLAVPLVAKILGEL